jgi:hypothetical protein
VLPWLQKETLPKEEAAKRRSRSSKHSSLAASAPAVASSLGSVGTPVPFDVDGPESDARWAEMEAETLLESAGRGEATILGQHR